MRTIGIIAEGHTDQLVIENVLLGFFSEEPDEPEIHFVQPQDSSPDAHGTYAPGGWTVLFDYLRRGGHIDALAYNDLLVIHVDTDVCEERGFDVRRNDDPAVLASEVQRRLCEIVGEEFIANHAHRVVFAIAVDSIECWLLPLRFPTKKAKAGKTAGCLRAVNDDLRRASEPLILKGEEKLPDGYKAASAPYRKRKQLLAHCDLHPSLSRFIAALRALPP